MPSEKRSPATDPGSERFGVARSALAPVHAEPGISSTQVSQYVLGHRLDLLSAEDDWWRVRGEDGYEGWVHRGYIEAGGDEWAHAWERGDGGESVVALGGMLLDDDEHAMMRLPWGARLVRETPTRMRLPDGRHGAPAPGTEVVATQRLGDRFPPRGESVARSARRWIGTPYIWGGVSPLGADCSGFVQSVFWMHGIALPRDSDVQAEVGERLTVDDAWETLRTGDLLFFAERADRVTHIALSLGGPRIIHCSLTNGGVRTNDMAGGLEVEATLRDIFVHARRVLPD